jgi:DNA-binding winged helix-turn-helix (wHTH) protein/predicted ATPase
MGPSDAIAFGPFRLELAENRLWREGEKLELQPRPLALLRYLATHPGRLVSKEELLEVVWTGTIVSKTTLKVCVRTVREVLGEDAAAPRYIQTVGREGYRFIAEVQGVGGSEVRVLREDVETALTPSPSTPNPLSLVGREAELNRLHRSLESTVRGRRRLVFVTGEAGIGKTTLVERFSNQVRANDAARVAHGQCLEHHGEGEPYLPVLEVMARLCRERDGDRVTRLLRRYAPTWLLQLPGFVNDGELEALQRQVAGAGRDRMIREMAEALEILAAERPLVLVLEDLHWSDVSTLDLIAYLAQRREPARLLLIGTFRPTDVIVHDHPLRGIKQGLQARGQCEELRLELLTRGAIAAYVASRLGAGTVSAELADLIHRRTQGNALFMVEVVDHLVARGLVARRQGEWELQASSEETESTVPENLRQLIDKQVARLSPDEQRLLEVASVAGAELTAGAVAAGLKREAEEIEERCEELVAKSSFLRESGIAEWPDGTIGGTYRFVHVLYRNVLYDRVSEARRVRLHRLIAERQEAAYGARAAEIAAELALHFEHGREYQRAVHHLLQAADNALRREGHREAIRHFSKGLDLLAKLPETSERTQQELLLCFRLGVSLAQAKGFAAPEVERAVARAQALLRRLGDAPETLLVLPLLRGYHFVRGDLPTAQTTVQQLLTVAERTRDGSLILWGHFGLGENLFYLGEPMAARESFERALAHADPRPYRPTGPFRGVLDAGIASRSALVPALWLLGYPDTALRAEREALAQAQESSDPATLSYAFTLAGFHHWLRREGTEVRKHAEAAIVVARDNGFPYWLAWATILRGWALTEEGHDAEGLAQLQRGIDDYEATGAGIGRPLNLALLGMAHHRAGRCDLALEALDEALAATDATQIRCWEAELHRLKGELLLEQGGAHPRRKSRARGRRANVGEAEQCFLRAIEIARAQQAKAWELRAVTSLSRLWQRQDKTSEAGEMLAGICAWFTEGSASVDLEEARSLLTELTSPAGA